MSTHQSTAERAWALRAKSLPSVVCPACSRPQRYLTAAGRIRRHYDLGQRAGVRVGPSDWCPASGKTPDEASAAAQEVGR